MSKSDTKSGAKGPIGVVDAAEFQVEHFHRVNRLKLRVGGTLTDHAPGQIDPKAVRAADAIVAEAARGGKDEIGQMLGRLAAAWVALRDLPPDAPSEARRKAQEAVFLFSHEIKDMAALCRYSLITDFAESLRDYIERAELGVEARRVIVQAHVDTLNAALRSGITGSDHPMARQLWQAIRAAIAKYH
jgi:hypothetical protein